MTKLITGGLGFIGVYLARALLKKGEEVVLFDVVTKSPLIHDIKDKVKIVQGCYHRLRMNPPPTEMRTH